MSPRFLGAFGRFRGEDKEQPQDLGLVPVLPNDGVSSEDTDTGFKPKINVFYSSSKQEKRVSRVEKEAK